MPEDRKNIDVSLKWRLEDIYGNDAAWEKEFSEARKRIAAFPAHAGTLARSADALFDALMQQSGIDFLLERLYTYAHMRKDEDNGVTKYSGMTDRAMQLATEFAAASAFLSPEILAIPREQLASCAAEERFSPFRFGLSDLDRQRAHRLSEGEERILALSEEPLSGADNIFTMLTDVDMTFGSIIDETGAEKTLTYGSYSLFIQSYDRRVREDAYKKLYASFQRMKNTLSATYAASVKGDLFRATARGFSGCAEAALFDGNVPFAVYEQLLSAVHEALPAMEKYLNLKKRALGLDQLSMFDLYVPMVPDAEIPMDFTEAKKTVKEALLPLGRRYQALLDQAYSDRWIDVVETPGKTSGAYSWGVYGTHPYVLLNHQDNVDHAFTLCHELGHAMHSFFSDEAQPYELAQYRIMVAEVASTVNESLMMRHLLETETDKKRRAYLINQFLEQFRTTCFRQTMFAEFELSSHRMAERGEPLTVESLSSLYRKLNETYYPGVLVDDDIAIEWMRIPHFYRAFYVYQYATGLCTAVALSEDILKNGPERYLSFLKSGGSDYPVTLLQNAGVDLTKKESIRHALSVFSAYVDELEQLL